MFVFACTEVISICFIKVHSSHILNIVFVEFLIIFLAFYMQSYWIRSHKICIKKIRLFEAFSIFHHRELAINRAYLRRHLGVMWFLSNSCLNFSKLVLDSLFLNSLFFLKERIINSAYFSNVHKLLMNCLLRLIFSVIFQ